MKFLKNAENGLNMHKKDKLHIQAQSAIITTNGVINLENQKLNTKLLYKKQLSSFKFNFKN